MPQRVSPLTTVYSDGRVGLQVGLVTLAEASPLFCGSFSRRGWHSIAQNPPGTKLAKATTKVIIVFRMAALTCGYGARDPYSEKGLRPFSHVVR